MVHQQVIEHAARDRSGVGGTEARVFHHHRECHGGRLQRRKRHIKRVIALVLFQFARVVLVFLPDRHRLRGARLAAAAVARASEDAG